ncbi:hypothetical protein [Brevibacillus sp. NRS-1366]|uniref:hypothetical protein n=1 Tax=Brevibacillus sp. NRS-1366 TaxID=3233899 RepID=UPI003D2323D1
MKHKLKSLDRETLNRMYHEENLTDLEIATLYGADRTAVVHLRKKFKISSRETNRDKALQLVTDKLLELGYQVINTKETNKIAEYDLLVNGNVKIEVISTGNVSRGGFSRFVLTTQMSNNVKESATRIVLPNSRYKKLHRLITDFIIFVLLKDVESYFWVIPSNVIGDNVQTISLRPISKSSKFDKYKEAWDLIEGIGGRE